MSLPIIKNQTQEAEDLLLWEWRNSPNLKGLLKSYIENIQSVEVAMFESLDERGIAIAIGEQLDVLGRIVGELRGGRDDETYRVALVSRIVANNSDGSTEVVLGALKAITKSPTVTFFEHYPGSIHLWAERGVSNGIVKAMDGASSAGISTRVLYDLDKTMFLAAEYTEVADILLVDNLQQYIDVVDTNANIYNLVMGGFGTTQTEVRSIFPENIGISSQQITNEDFLVGLTDWTTVSGTPSVTLGVLTLNSGDSITQSMTTVASGVYSVMIDSLSTTNTFEVLVGTTSGGAEIATFDTEFDSLGDISQFVYFTATGTTTYITLSDTGGTSTIDAVACGDKWTHTTYQNPLCDVLDATDFGLELGNIVDNLGDTVIDDEADNIKYIN